MQKHVNSAKSGGKGEEIINFAKLGKILLDENIIFFFSSEKLDIFRKSWVIF